MKSFASFFIICLLVFSCAKEKEKQPPVIFKKYDETAALAEQQNHESNRMRFKLFQSKVLDMNEVFKPFEEDLAYFSEADYEELKPLIIEQDIPTIQQAIKDRKLTYEKLTLFYLYRIRKFESDSTKSLNGIIALNPNVVKEAKMRDINKDTVSEFSIYGMPILLKDNINTKEMPTTAGALALENNNTNSDAFIVEKLKENGALILGKVNLSEWAYYFCSGCPLGYSAIGGQTLNPYGRAEFETGGSSSGSGVTVAANYAVAAVGTETAGSITSPSSQNSVVGLKPTIGVFSRTGIVPISSTLDTPGPMTKSVVDNAIFMNAMLGYDTNDTASKEIDEDYYQNGFNLDLEGKRLGVFQGLMNDSIYASTIEKFKKVGVEIVELNPENMSYNGFTTLLNIDMKNDLPKYLADNKNDDVTVKDIASVIEFNNQDSITRAPYGQQLFEGIEQDNTTVEDFENIKMTLNKDAIKYLAALEEENLDAILSINNYHSAVTAVAKYPTLTVPMGYKTSREPISLTFIGLPFTERKLLEVGYAFEQMTKVRKLPLGYE